MPLETTDPQTLVVSPSRNPHLSVLFSLIATEPDETADANATCADDENSKQDVAGRDDPERVQVQSLVTVV